MRKSRRPQHHRLVQYPRLQPAGLAYGVLWRSPALDPQLVGEVLSVIRGLAHEHDLTTLLVTHEMRFAREVSDRVCFFDKGWICEQGAPEEIFGAPRQERTRAFLSSVLA